MNNSGFKLTMEGKPLLVGTTTLYEPKQRPEKSLSEASPAAPGKVKSEMTGDGITAGPGPSTQGTTMGITNYTETPRGATGSQKTPSSGSSTAPVTDDDIWGSTPDYEFCQIADAMERVIIGETPDPKKEPGAP